MNTRNKYGSKRTKYGGRTYHSKKEAKYALQLDWLVKAGEVKEWKPQHRIPLKVNGTVVTTYIMDFRVLTASGDIEYHEVKGAETPLWKVKWKLLKAILSVEENPPKLVLVK